MNIILPCKAEPEKKPWGSETLLLNSIGFWRQKGDDTYVETPYIKLIENKFNLSLQNHSKKYESWMFLDSPGFYITCKDINNADKTLQVVPIESVIDIPPGYPHAIAANSLVIEVQDRIDSTNRIMDFPELIKFKREMNLKEAKLAYQKFLAKPKEKPFSLSLETKFAFSDIEARAIVAIEPYTKLFVAADSGDLQTICLDRYRVAVVQLGKSKTVLVESNKPVFVTSYV